MAGRIAKSFSWWRSIAKEERRQGDNNRQHICRLCVGGVIILTSFEFDALICGVLDVSACSARQCQRSLSMLALPNQIGFEKVKCRTASSVLADKRCAALPQHTLMMAAV
jgi:hypothetical protein